MTARLFSLLALLGVLILPASAAPPVVETWPDTGVQNNTVHLYGAVELNSPSALIGFQLREAGKKHFRRAFPRLTRAMPNSYTNRVVFTFEATVKEDTDYEFRTVAIVRGRKFYGPVRTFHSSAFPPEILSLDVTRLSINSYAFNAVVQPHGRPGYAVLSWITNASPATLSAPVPFAGGTQPVSIQFVVMGLETNHVYFYTVGAVNDFDGTSASRSISTYPIPSLSGGGGVGAIRQPLPPGWGGGGRPIQVIFP